MTARPSLVSIGMDLCLMIEGQEGVTWPQWVALARACEEHGVPALFRSDHYLELGGDRPQRGSLDAWTTLAALGAVTTTLRLGTLVSPATFRHPSVLAKAVATADHVSDGRVELGIGAGWHAREHEAYGFAFPPPRDRMDILEEQLQVILGSWSDGPFSFDAKHYSLSDLDAQPKPAQRPHPPIIIGGNAGPRSAALAARHADEYNTVFPTPAEARERRAAVERACEAAGREPLPLSVMTGVLLGRDRGELQQRARRLAEVRGGDAASFLAQPPSGWIVGTLDDAAAQIAALGDAGVQRIMCQHLLHDDLDAVALIGRELPALH
jgi:F420-dependent oxidoreductase-like protein